MASQKTDSLSTSVCAFREALAADAAGSEKGWADRLQAALGALGNALQDEIGQSKRTKDIVNEVNPDMNATPTVERHVGQSRDRKIKMGEEVHILRADLRRVGADSLRGLEGLRQRGVILANEIEAMQHENTAFLLDAMNSNPGSGE